MTWSSQRQEWVFFAQPAGQTVNSGRNTDKDKSMTAFTCSPAGGFGSEEWHQGGKKSCCRALGVSRTGGGPRGGNDTHMLTIIPLASWVCKTNSYLLEPPYYTRQEAKPRRKGQPREVKWFAQDHTALTGLSQGLTLSLDAQSPISPNSSAAPRLRWSSVAELMVDTSGWLYTATEWNLSAVITWPPRDLDDRRKVGRGWGEWS